MARGPRLSSPAVQSSPWSYESTSNNAQMMPMPDIRLKFISCSYPPRRAACSTKPQRIVSNFRVLFLQILPARGIWDITMGCSTSRPRRMKTSISSSRASLVGHLELLRKEPAYDQCLVRSGTSDRSKQIGILLCGDAQTLSLAPNPALTCQTWPDPSQRGTSIVVATTSRAPWMLFSEPKQSPDL